MLRLTTSLTTTAPLRPFEFPTTVSISVPLSIHLLLLSGTTIVPLSIYIPFSLELFGSLSVSSACFLPVPLPLPSRADHPFLACSYAARFYIYLSVSRILCSPFSFFVSFARHPATFTSLAPPSNRRSTGRFCI